ncbi:MAG: MBL fold metallo-hydrolase [Anaerolineae bacterium]
MNILNVGYDSTNYYILADTRPKLLVDAGWPRSLGRLQNECKRYDIQLKDIPYMIVTHFHPDHAGLVQELKDLGMYLLIVDIQKPFIPELKKHMKPRDEYVEIDLRDNTVITLEQSRRFLAKLGVQGELIATPGHSDDSISLILDEGVAFTGDLTHPRLLIDPADPCHRSWDKLRSRHVKTVYGGHGPSWQLQ